MSTTPAPHAHFGEHVKEHTDHCLPPHRRQVADQLFKAFDLDGNGALSLTELTQVLEAVKSRRQQGKGGAPVDATLERQRTRWMATVHSQIRQHREQLKRKQSAASFALKGHGGSSNVGQITFTADVMAGDGDPSLDPDAFAEFIRVYSGKYDETEFAVFTDELHAAVEEAYQNTFGSKKKKLVWELFQLIDVNHDGVVDMKELQVLLRIQSKKDKKSLAKWKARLGQRRIDKRRASMHLLQRSNSKKSSDGEGSFSAGAVPTLERKKSTFVSTDDGIVTIQDEEVTGHDSDDESEEEISLGLKDFQEFIDDYYGDDMDAIDETCQKVRTMITDNHKRYLSEMKVDEIMNDIIEDLLRERPHDVLEGISRSVQRLRRLGHFPTKLYRSWSISSHPFAKSPTPGDEATLLSPSD